MWLARYVGVGCASRVRGRRRVSMRRPIPSVAAGRRQDDRLSCPLTPTIGPAGDLVAERYRQKGWQWPGDRSRRGLARMRRKMSSGRCADFEEWRAQSRALADIALTRGVFHTLQAGDGGLRRLSSRRRSRPTPSVCAVWRQRSDATFGQRTPSPAQIRSSCCAMTCGSACSNARETSSADGSRWTASRPRSSA